MNKWWTLFILCLTLVLSACSEKEEVDKPKENMTEEEAETGTKPNENEKEGSLILQETTNESILTTLGNLINDYGYIYDDFEFKNGKYEVGLIYARIVDFNNDGVNELVTVHKGSSYFDSNYDHRVTDDYVLEIWGTDYNEFKTLYTRSISIDSCSACDLSVGIVALEDGTSVYYEGSKQTAQGQTVENMTYFVMEQPGEFIQKHFDSSYGISNAHEIDGKSVQETAYLAEKKAFSGDQEAIITSLMGTKEFTYKEKSSAKMVADILNRYDNNFDEIAAVGEQGDIKMIQDALERIRDISRVDVLDPTLTPRMASYIILTEEIEQDLPAYDVYLSISEKQVAEKYEGLFGVPLSMDDVDMASPDSEEYEVIAYKDGVFYLLPTDISRSEVIREVNRAVKLDDDTYYIETTDIEFAKSNYSIEYDVFYDEIDQFLVKPYSEWPSDAKKFSISNIKRYIVLKMVDGQPTFRYIGYRPLTLEQVYKY